MQEARINSLSTGLKQTKKSLHIVHNELAVAKSAIAVSRLNDELRTKEQTYNRYSNQYQANYEAFNQLFRKKMLIHGALSGAGVAVAGPVGFYALGAIGFVNLMKPDDKITALYRTLVANMNQMKTIRLELEGYATQNPLARNILTNLQSVPALPSTPPGYG